MLRAMEHDLGRPLTEREEQCLWSRRGRSTWSERQRHRPVTDGQHFSSCHAPSGQTIHDLARP
jgi:hypothetical protein